MNQINKMKDQLPAYVRRAFLWAKQFSADKYAEKLLALCQALTGRPVLFWVAPHSHFCSIWIHAEFTL